MAAASRTQLIEQVRAMPTRPGVYIFREASGEVIYVGKAASLKSRVRSYFGSPRRPGATGARYFGPYASAGSVRQTLDLVKKLFPWRSCTKTITGNDPRPCLDYYIHRCIGPCAALCSQEEYDEVIRQVILFLEGRTEEVTRDLRAGMAGASTAP